MLGRPIQPHHPRPLPVGALEALAAIKRAGADKRPARLPPGLSFRLIGQLRAEGLIEVIGDSCLVRLTEAGAAKIAGGIAR